MATSKKTAQPTPAQSDEYLKGVEDATKGNPQANRKKWYLRGYQGKPLA